MRTVNEQVSRRNEDYGYCYVFKTILQLRKTRSFLSARDW
jgi:hypothetical protein